MADDKYRVDFEVDTTKAVKSLGDVERAASKTAATFDRGLAPATNRVASASAKTAEGIAKTQAQFERAITGTAAFTGALASLGPQLGPVGAGLAAMTQGAGALSAAMGPAGLVIGGVVGLLPSLIEGITDAASATDEAAGSQARWTREIVEARDRLERLTETIERSRERATAFRNVLTRGFFDAADAAGIEAQIAAAQLRTTTLREQVTRAQQRGNIREALSAEGDIVELEGRITVLNLALDEARRKEAAVQEAGKFEPAERPQRRERDRTAELEKEKNAAIRLFQEEASVAQQLVDKEWERLEAVKQIAEQEARTLAAIEESLQLKNKLAQDERDQADFARQIEQAEGEKNKAMIAFKQEQADEQERYNEIVARTQAGLEGMVDIFGRARDIQRDTESSFGKAFKSALDEWLKGFARQEVMKGATATAEAIGLAITNPPAAGSKVASAAAHFALAGAAGGAAALIPGGGGGGGGANGGRAARPESFGGGGGGGGGGTTIINFNSPVSEAEIGRMQRRSLRAADRRHGPR